MALSCPASGLDNYVFAGSLSQPAPNNVGVRRCGGWPLLGDGWRSDGVAAAWRGATGGDSVCSGPLFRFGVIGRGPHCQR